MEANVYTFAEEVIFRIIPEILKLKKFEVLKSESSINLLILSLCHRFTFYGTFLEPCFTFYVLAYGYVLVYSPELGKPSHVLPFTFYHTAMFYVLILCFDPNLTFVEP